ncbi:MAG: hypothetical protein ACJ72R_19290 [Nitrososphaeraceae archaeon]
MNRSHFYNVYAHQYNDPMLYDIYIDGKGFCFMIYIDGKGFCFMEIGDKKAGYIDTDFYNEAGPTTRLDPPSDEFYQKKLDFERSRLNEWLM